MKVELGDLIQATELGKNMGGFLAEAAAGRRMVVLYNGVPMGALVGLGDFERIGEHESAALDQHATPARASLIELRGGAAATFWQLAESLPARHSVVGVKPDGGCVTLPVAAHYLFVAEDEQDLQALQKSAILGSTLTASPEELQLVLVTTRPVHSFTEEFGFLKVPHVVAEARDLEFADVAERLSLQLQGEVDRRGRMLRESRIGSIARYRDKFPDRAIDVPDLIVAVDYAQELRQDAPQVWKLLHDVGRRLDYYGIYVWQFATELSGPPPKWVSTRIAGRVETAADSRSLLFTTDAARNLGGGEAYVGRVRSAPELFKIAAPDVAVPAGIYGQAAPRAAASLWPVFPRSVDLDDVIDRWQRDMQAPASFSDAAFPIGLIDRPESREVALWPVNLRAPVWLWGASASSAARVRVLELIIQAASQVYPAMQVWAIGLNLPPNAQVTRVAQQASELVDELYARVRSGKSSVSELPEDKWVLLVIDRDVAFDVDKDRLDFVVREGPGCGVCVVQTTRDSPSFKKPENWIQLSEDGRSDHRFKLLASAPAMDCGLVNACDVAASSVHPV